MSPAEIRKAADSFDPMKAFYWTPWQTLSRVVHRDKDRVRECSDVWRERGPSSPVEGAPLKPFRRIWEEMHNKPGAKEGWAEAEMRPNPVRDRWAKLWHALESGRVKLSGRDSATGRQREISALDCPDLIFSQSYTTEETGRKCVGDAGPQCYWEGTDLRTADPAFRDIRVRVAEVLKEFPAKGCEGSSRPMGARPPAADWYAIEEAFNKEVDLLGPPHKDAGPGWRTVGEWVRENLGDAEPSKTTVNEHARKMLQRRMERDEK